MNYLNVVIHFFLLTFSFNSVNEQDEKRTQANFMIAGCRSNYDSFQSYQCNYEIVVLPATSPTGDSQSGNKSSKFSAACSLTVDGHNIAHEIHADKSIFADALKNAARNAGAANNEKTKAIFSAPISSSAYMSSDKYQILFDFNTANGNLNLNSTRQKMQFDHPLGFGYISLDGVSSPWALSEAVRDKRYSLETYTGSIGGHKAEWIVFKSSTKGGISYCYDIDESRGFLPRNLAAVISDDFTMPLSVTHLVDAREQGGNWFPWSWEKKIYRSTNGSVMVDTRTLHVSKLVVGSVGKSDIKITIPPGSLITMPPNMLSFTRFDAQTGISIDDVPEIEKRCEANLAIRLKDPLYVEVYNSGKSGHVMYNYLFYIAPLLVFGVLFLCYRLYQSKVKRASENKVP